MSFSYAISLLEQELGTKLFEKNGRNISLTKYGRIFAQSVEKAFEQLDMARISSECLQALKPDTFSIDP